MSNLLKNLLFALGLAILLFLAYMIFFKNEDTATLSVSGGGISPQAELKTQELLATTQKLESYKIDGTLFSDARFKSLVNFRIELIEEPTGRENPFAPIR